MNKDVNFYVIGDKNYYGFAPGFFSTEVEAELVGYYWHDEVGVWVKEILDNTTTIF